MQCIFPRLCDLQIVSYFSKLGTKPCSSCGRVSGGRADLLAQVWRKYTKRAFLSFLSFPGQKDWMTVCSVLASRIPPGNTPPNTHTHSFTLVCSGVVGRLPSPACHPTEWCQGIFARGQRARLPQTHGLSTTGERLDPKPPTQCDH